MMKTIRGFLDNYLNFIKVPWFGFSVVITVMYAIALLASIVEESSFHVQYISGINAHVFMYVASFVFLKIPLWVMINSDHWDLKNNTTLFSSASWIPVVNTSVAASLALVTSLFISITIIAVLCYPLYALGKKVMSIEENLLKDKEDK